MRGYLYQGHTVYCTMQYQTKVHCTGLYHPHPGPSHSDTVRGLQLDETALLPGGRPGAVAGTGGPAARAGSTHLNSIWLNTHINTYTHIQKHIGIHKYI